jgi:hypothetical protein
MIIHLYMKKLLLLLSLASMATTSRAQLMMYLAGRCNYKYTGTTYSHTDSASYLYNGVNHRRIFSPQDWSYDTCLVYDMNISSVVDVRYLRTYDAGFNKTSELLERYFPGSGQYRTEMKDAYMYDANGYVIMHENEEAQFSTGILEKQYKETYQYNPTKQLTDYTRQAWDAIGGVYENQLNIVYTYDGSGRLQQEMHQVPNGSGWVDDMKVTHTGTSPLDTTILIEQWSGGTWNPSMRVMETYNGTGDLVSSEREMWNFSTWEPQSAEYYTYTSGNLQYASNSYWNGTMYEPVDRYEYTYLHSDRILTLVQKEWNGSAYVPNPGNDSSYFHYLATGNVGDVPATAGKIHIYPSPASSYITLQSGMVLQHCTATLCDMSGRVVKVLTGITGNIARMYVDDVPAGNYILNVNGSVNTREKIVIAR